jgi:DNA polymerase-3 subunit beta
VTVRANFVSFTIGAEGEGSGAGDSVIGSRFIEGEFPNYRQLIPQGYPNALTVGRDTLMEVTKRVGLLAQNNLPVKLRLGAELEVSAHTPDVGEGQEVLDADYEGEEIVIAFNPQFLYDGVATIQSDKVILEVGDGLKPAILRGEEGTDFTYLLMPVRLS